MEQEILLDQISDDFLISLALKEDIGKADITTEAILKGVSDRTVKATLIAKEDLILAGLELFEMTFKKIDPEVKIITDIGDEDFCKKGSVILYLEGKFSSILKGERVALNILQHLSGIATNTYKVVEELKGTKIKILDTRKTIPLWRKWEKYAVRVGGGYNHRMRLYDMFLIKENHIAVAGSISKAVMLAKNYDPNVKIEVEVRNFNEVKEAVDTEADIIMLDNMDDSGIKNCVKYIRENSDKNIEVSGNITLERIKRLRDIDIDFISMGALTHSVKAADISLILEV